MSTLIILMLANAFCLLCTWSFNPISNFFELWKRRKQQFLAEFAWVILWIKMRCFDPRSLLFLSWCRECFSLPTSFSFLFFLVESLYYKIGKKRKESYPTYYPYSTDGYSVTLLVTAAFYSPPYPAALSQFILNNNNNNIIFWLLRVRLFFCPCKHFSTHLTDFSHAA